MTDVSFYIAIVITLGLAALSYLFGRFQSVRPTDFDRLRRIVQDGVMLAQDLKQTEAWGKLEGRGRKAFDEAYKYAKVEAHKARIDFDVETIEAQVRIMYQMMYGVK